MSTNHSTDFVSFSLVLFCYCLFVEISIVFGLDVSPSETWEFSDETLTGNTRHPYSAWNSDSSYPECVFIFGGWVCTNCNTLYCYNITDDTLSEFGELDSSLSSTRWVASHQAAFIISNGDDDLLYYVTTDGNVYYYDLNDPDSSTDVLKTSIDVNYPMLLKHPDNTEFYAIDGQSSGSYAGDFYVYDLVEHEIHQGNDMNVARLRPSAIVNNYDEDNPYIYVLSGRTAWIERININDARNNKWEKLQLILSNSISSMSSITVGSYYLSSIATYNNFIYLLGGYDGSAHDEIYALDVENWELSWAGILPTAICCGTASFAQDRIYMFGGYTGSDQDDIYISNSFSQVTDQDISEDDDGISVMQTWKLSDETLTGNTRHAYSVWNGDSSYGECVFVFGGWVCTDCNTLYCYNITSNTLEEFGELDGSISSTRYTASQQAAFIISDGNDDLLYYITIDGSVYYYDLNDPDSTDVLKTSIDVYFPVLLKHPDNTEFYAIDGYSSGSYASDFYVYDLVENEIHGGNDMNVARYRPSAIVNNYDEDNPYIYVLSGRTTWVERININDARNNKWEKLQLVVSSSLSDESSFTDSSFYLNSIATYNNFIYLLGGYDGSAHDDIFALDVENWELTWAGILPTAICCGTASLGEDRIYMFGGYTGSDQDDIYISNSLSEVTELASSKSTSCDNDDDDGTTSTGPITTQPFHNKEGNKQLLNVNKDNVISNNNNNNYNNNNVYDIVVTALSLYGTFCICKSLLSKCRSIIDNNKDNKQNYQYQSI